jgi:dihydropteroate synthase
MRRLHRPVTWKLRDQTLSDSDHTLVMGVLNVTPDSFSDGGRYVDANSAIRHGLDLGASGADLVDVGGESTRPGADPVPVAAEIDRVVPVVKALAAAGIVVSIDTSKPAVASAAIDAGASIVNDVTALGDSEMVGVVAKSEAGLVLMHMQGQPRTMQERPQYEDVVREVGNSLESAAADAIDAGVDRRSICLDPGIGFGKDLGHNLDLLATGVTHLATFGFPVMVGASRKSFIAKILGSISTDERDSASAAAHVLAIAGGASIVRSHNVVMALRTARVADAIVRGL